ncbi:MAG: GtrA family protein [Mediterranea sp.]|jgi:putative flippase GtrA|nr:GtrA family protein [Mediterranea sp.]
MKSTLVPKLEARLSRACPDWRERLGQFVRFGIVGLTASAIHYGVYCLALLVMGATLSFTAGYAVALVCNYYLTTFFTFRSRPSSKNAAGFGLSHLVNYLLEVGLLNLFLWIGVGRFLAPIVVLVVVVPINFLLLHFVYTHTYKNRKA